MRRLLMLTGTPEAAAANPFQGNVTMTFELYDFGAPVDAEPPPDDQVADLQELMRQAGQG